jgi:cytochrome c553
MKPLIIAILLYSSVYYPLANADALEQLLNEFAATEHSVVAADLFSADKGKALWTKSFVNNKQSQARSCASCHTENLKAVGKHVKTRKPIEPLAPSVNNERLTDIKSINKWLLRNCKWTMGRECTAMEKGHLLTYIKTQ